MSSTHARVTGKNACRTTRAKCLPDLKQGFLPHQMHPHPRPLPEYRERECATWRAGSDCTNKQTRHLSVAGLFFTAGL